jgi:two-component system heavy metal sensor histidine kinase CusS
VKSRPASAILRELSMAARVTIVTTLAGLLLAALAGVLAHVALERELEQRARASLEGKSEQVQHFLHTLPDVSWIDSQGSQINEILIGHEGLHLAIVQPAASDRVLWSSSALGRVGAAQPARPVGDLKSGRLEDGRPYLILSRGFKLRDGTTVRYAVTMDRSSDVGLLRGFRRGMLIGVPVFLLLAGLGAWLAARAGLTPLKRFTALARTTSASNLAARIDLAGMPAEIRALAGEFNTMLERIDDGVVRLSEFSADLAHEMRTPVATLLGRTQVALSRKREAAELRATLESNVEEFARLNKLIEEMLFLARSEQGDEAVELTSVDFAAEVESVVDFLAPLAQERCTRMLHSGSATAIADRMLVRRAVTNVLINALRHADTREPVQVRLSQDGQHALVRITNRGRPIPAHLLAKIFERFVRVDSARDRGQGGTGLGLAIVASIMKLHDGSASAESDALRGETTFTLTFPMAGPRHIAPADAS